MHNTIIQLCRYCKHTNAILTQLNCRIENWSRTQSGSGSVCVAVDADIKGRRRRGARLQVTTLLPRYCSKHLCQDWMDKTQHFFNIRHVTINNNTCNQCQHSQKISNLNCLIFTQKWKHYYMNSLTTLMNDAWQCHSNIISYSTADKDMCFNATSNTCNTTNVNKLLLSAHSL